MMLYFCFFFSSRRRHTRWTGDWSSDVCSSDLGRVLHGEVTVTTANGGTRLVDVQRGTLSARTGNKVTVTSTDKVAFDYVIRSEERRVGKECRSRWSTYQEKKKKNKYE